MKPLGKISTDWSPELAYAIGLIVTDGSLSKDRRHINFTSKDMEMIQHFQNALQIECRVASKFSGFNKNEPAYYVQPGDVLFYRFLLDIGLMPNKTKTIGSLKIPKKYFFDFLRGHLDGDGCTYSYWDPRWRSSFMFYTCFVSASKRHVLWLNLMIANLLDISGHITHSSTVYQLKYAKAESLILLRKLYPNPKVLCLTRKRLKIIKMLAIIDQQLYKKP